MIIKIPKLHQDAVKYACEVYAVPVRFYTDEKNEGLVRVDIDITGYRHHSRRGMDNFSRSTDETP
jgi:hypothetical protein